MEFVYNILPHFQRFAIYCRNPSIFRQPLFIETVSKRKQVDRWKAARERITTLISGSLFISDTPPVEV